MAGQRDPKQTPRWWDQTDQGYELRFMFGTPGILDLFDMRIAALEGDQQALMWGTGNDSWLQALRREIEDAYQAYRTHPGLPLTKYTRLPHNADSEAT